MTTHDTIDRINFHRSEGRRVCAVSGRVIKLRHLLIAGMVILYVVGAIW